jgi:uncharacterized membrane protein YbhN (UPF0104 family)
MPADRIARRSVASAPRRRSPPAAVLAYRLILFWLPLIGGAIAFLSLRRALVRSERSDLCEPAPTR